MRSCGSRKIKYTIPLPTRLVAFLKNKSAKSILDVGCGCGRACFYLQRSGYDVVGVDVDKVQIKLAPEEIRSEGKIEATLLCGDARNLSFVGSSFDAATMLGILSLVKKSWRAQVVNDVYRVLKPSGYLFVEEFGRTWTNPVYAKRYREDLKATRELGTFTVKDEAGKILHFAHHFTLGELRMLFKHFRMISFEESVFTSYRHGNWARGYSILLQKTVI